MTARIVDVRVSQAAGQRHVDRDTADNHQWMAVLKSVAAYEFYRRQYHARIEPEKVAELLMLHPQHPRSIRFNIADGADGAARHQRHRARVPTRMKPSG